MKDYYTLVGNDSHALSVISYVSKCMEAEGKTKSEIEQYSKIAMSQDYNFLLCRSQDVINELNGED